MSREPTRRKTRTLKTMFGLLMIAFVVVPILELVVIIEVGSAIGVWETLFLLVAVSVLGAWLTRHEGFAVLRRMRAQLESGRLPGNEIIDGALVLGGGLLLLTPGFITDALGLCALFPPTRAPMRALVRRRLRLRVSYSVSPPPSGDDDVIDI